jgi:hypothetical protein
VDRKRRRDESAAADKESKDAKAAKAEAEPKRSRNAEPKAEVALEAGDAVMVEAASAGQCCQFLLIRYRIHTPVLFQVPVQIKK